MPLFRRYYSCQPGLKLTHYLAVKVFLSSGSHLLINAEWGCMDGVHTGWLSLDVDSKEEALSIVPPAFRSAARVVELNSFTLDFINSEIERLDGDAAG